MLSFLHRWDYSWKCEFDTDINLKIIYHDGEQLGFYKEVNLLGFLKKVHRAKRMMFL